MQSAAGGIIQRLKPADAIVRSLSMNAAPAPDIGPLILVIRPSLQLPLLGVSAVYNPVLSPSPQAAPHIAAPHHLRHAPGSLSAFENLTPDATGYARLTRQFRLENITPPHDC